MDENVNQTINDDQELAKALAGISDQPGDNAQPASSAPTDLPAPTAGDPTQPADVAPTDGGYLVSPTDAAPASGEPVIQPLQPNEQPADASVQPGMPTSGDGELDSIKMQALNELRPLVDKLNVEPDEKFDTYLLLLRSTDDKALIEPAHEAAKAIPDETRRAQALLDIIKEIDFLSQDKPAA